MRREIARDLERKILGVMEDTLRREMEIAKLALTPAEIGMLMMMIAKGTLTSTAGTIAGMMPAEERERMFLGTIDQISAMAQTYWPEAQAAIIRLYQEQGR